MVYSKTNSANELLDVECEGFIFPNSGVLRDLRKKYKFSRSYGRILIEIYVLYVLKTKLKIFSKFEGNFKLWIKKRLYVKNKSVLKDLNNSRQLKNKLSETYNNVLEDYKDIIKDFKI
jgi:hypothetical protein